VADSLEACATGKEMKMSAIKYKRVDVDGFGVAYRDAGPANGPALLLLHGFPTSSHMFRDLIPKLADRYRVVAPDLPGFDSPICRRASSSSTRSRIWRR
jgi:pimeloyl-ACP methyl ester carboxylesterase